MSLSSATANLLKSQTPLQLLLEEINFQRTKEMRQMLKDDSGFVLLQGTTYWTDLFVRHFLFLKEPVHSIDSDDLLFFVRKKHVKSSSRHMPKYETEVEVFRKDSRKLPIGDPDVDWEETVYLNMVIHQFDYTLTLAICTRTSPKELQVLRRHSQRVYASPSRRKMDTKGEGEEITYPHICFMVDNFDEVFSDILVRDGEMVCVELVANDKDGAVQGVIFLGSIRYDALKKVYDARQSSLSSKVAQRMSFGLFSSGAGVQTRCEFVRMKGPQGKGHAEMAVTKPKGSGVETPTSEPGFCATDMWDEWEEENDDYCTYRHQRRLSDPSANLNNFSRYGWRTKNPQDITGTSAGVKARSENEGLDNLASEVSEIEAGDLRDDLRPAFSVSAANLHKNLHCESSIKLAQKNGADPVTDLQESDESSTLVANSSGADVLEADAVEVSTPEDNLSALNQILQKQESTTGCGNCFGGKKSKQRRWIAKSAETPEMSEIYCPSCEDTTNKTPACLNKMPDKKSKLKPKTILSVESELVISKRSSLRLSDKKKINITRSISLSSGDRRPIAKKLERQTPREREKSKTNSKDKDKSNKNNDVDKENVKKTSKYTASSILSKVSPKRMRNKVNNEKTNNQNVNNSKIPKSAPSNNLAPSKTKHPISDECKLQAQEYEIADDATSLSGEEISATNSECNPKMAILSISESKLRISVRGKEELPVVEESALKLPKKSPAAPSSPTYYSFEKCVNVNVPEKSESESVPIPEIHALKPKEKTLDSGIKVENARIDLELDSNESTLMLNDCNGNHDAAIETARELENEQRDITDEDNAALSARSVKRNAAQKAFYQQALNLVPKRRTPDGTNIYYWCDLTKKSFKELDDGAYNPLWASRGFTQSFHFWKENRRAQSTPLNAFLTYVTLPWWSIAKDLLDHRETPILTF